MALTLMIIFAVGVLLGVALGLPALRRWPRDETEENPIRPVGRELIPVGPRRSRRAGANANGGTAGASRRRFSAARRLAGPKVKLLEAPSAYDDMTCELFVSPLGDDVLARAVTLFEYLETTGEVDSTHLAEALGAAPSALGGLLTGRLNRRAQQLGLKPPYEVERTSGRTIWRDQQGTAGRLLGALRREITSRRRAAVSSAQSPPA
ncbi:MAG: hypothetical protein OEM67_00600 [Thermoleophilia bacterium]|nr:hypothetical protein [Thermoleophilia bacterium]MDH3725699.1 hypothetical protein [Thermoleophilia bacterium]